MKFGQKRNEIIVKNGILQETHFFEIEHQTEKKKDKSKR